MRNALIRLSLCLLFSTGICTSDFSLTLAANLAANDSPNVILIVSDDLGYADLSCYGATGIQTPALDRLAKQGTRFTNFNVAQAVCTASRAAFLSGCYPNRLGMAGALNHTSLTGIHPDELLLSELFQARGYATACYGKWHLGTRTEFDPQHNGFESWFGLPYSNDNGPLHPSIRGIPSLPLIDNGKTVALDPDQSTFTKIFTEKAIEFISLNKTKPFFLYLPHVMPHVPIAASAKFTGTSQRGLYGDVVEEEDFYIGELLKAVESNGLDDNTIVIFFSDNGPFLSYGSHAGSAAPYREGKLTTFEGGVRVPLIVRWPKHIPADHVSNEFITGLDLLPTLAKIANLPQPKLKIDGEDLSTLLLGEPNAKGRQKMAYYSGTELHAVRDGKWKLHLPHDFITVNGPTRSDGKPANYDNMAPAAIEESGVRGIASRHGYKVEKIELSLFDLEQDPAESKNVAEENPQIVAKLSAMADEYRKDLGDSILKVTGTGLRPVGRAVP